MYGWMTGVESVQKGLKGLSRIRPYTQDVIDVTLQEGGLEGLILQETRLQGIHEEIRIGGLGFWVLGVPGGFRNEWVCLSM